MVVPVRGLQLRSQVLSIPDADAKLGCTTANPGDACRQSMGPRIRQEFETLPLCRPLLIVATASLTAAATSSSSSARNAAVPPDSGFGRLQVVPTRQARRRGCAWTLCEDCTAKRGRSAIRPSFLEELPRSAGLEVVSRTQKTICIWMTKMSLSTSAPASGSTLCIT